MSAGAPAVLNGTHAVKPDAFNESLSMGGTCQILRDFAVLDSQRKSRATTQWEQPTEKQLGVDCKRGGRRFEFTIPYPLNLELQVTCPNCGVVSDFIQPDRDQTHRVPPCDLRAR